MSDDTLPESGPGPNIPQDRVLKTPIAEPDPTIENKKGKLVSKPNTDGLEKSAEVEKLPSLENLEKQISDTFFKTPSQTRDQLGASLISGSFERIRSKATAFTKRWSDTGSRLNVPQPTADGITPPPTNTTGGVQTSKAYLGAVLAGHQAQVEQLRFMRTYSLPYMKRNLALAYLRTDYARKQLGLTDQLRRDLLAKLDTVKTNTAVPDAAKGSLFSKIKEETRRQAIARVASSIQDIGFQYANRFYTNVVTRKASDISARLTGGAGLRDLISDAGRSRTRSLLASAASLRQREHALDQETPGNRALSAYYRKRRELALSGARRAKGLVKEEQGTDFGGKLLAPVADFAKRYNPFNKSIFTPVMASGTGDDFVASVGADGKPTTKAGPDRSPLFYAFTSWVTEYRKDQSLLRRILLGEKVKLPNGDDRSDPAKSALKKWNRAYRPPKDLVAKPPVSKNGGFFKSFFASSQFKDVKEAAAKKIDDVGKVTSAKGGVSGFVSDIWNAKRADLSSLLRGKDDTPPAIPRGATEVTPEDPKTGPSLPTTLFARPFVDGVKDTLSAFVPSRPATPEPQPDPDINWRKRKKLARKAATTEVADSVLPASRKKTRPAPSGETKRSPLFTKSTTTPRKEKPTAQPRPRRVSAAVQAAAETAETTKSIQQVMRVAAGLGLLATPLALRKFSKSTSDTLKEVGNRPIAPDVSSVVQRARSAGEQAVSRITETPTVQSIQNSEPVRTAEETLSRTGRRAKVLGKRGLKYVQKSKLGRTALEKLESIPVYHDVMRVVNPPTLADRILGGKRTNKVARDLRSLKAMDYKTLGRVGVSVATGTAAIAAGKYGYDLLRGRDPKPIGDQARTYFGIPGLNLDKLVQNLKDPKFYGVVSDGERKRLELGEPLQKVLSGAQIGDLSKLFRKHADEFSETIRGQAHSLGDRLNDVVERHVPTPLGQFARAATSTGIDEASKVAGSLTDNLLALGRVVGLRPKDNIFTQYTKGLSDINDRVKSGGSLFKSVLTSVLSPNKEKRSAARMSVLGTVSVKAGASWLKRHLATSNRDRIIAEGIANRSPVQKAARVGLLTARNVFYNPERFTREEFAERKQELADRKQARKEKLKASAEAFKKSRAESREKREAKLKARDNELKRQKQALKDAKNPTLASLLLGRLGLGPQPRTGSWKELMKQRDQERRGSWYSWRRAFGRKNLKKDDIHQYADRFGLFGGLMDKGSAFSNSLVGTVAGQALGLAGRGAMGAARLGWRGALLGKDAVKTIGLRGAVKAGKGVLPLLGGGLKMAGGLLKGPLGIGLLAHEVDQGFAENTTGKTRRVGTTLSKMAEYGAMGAFFGPWGIAIGAAVGGLVANMDVVTKAVKGVGHALGYVTKPLWNVTKAVAKGALGITKFSGRVVKGAWTTIFGSSAKFDKHGRVIQKEKNSILGDFRTSLFGQKAKYTKDGQLISTAKRSVFGLIHDGFTKTFFGDKFSNGSYKPGTSLVDQAWDGMKSGISATGTFFKNLPGKMWATMKKGMSSLWGGLTSFLKKDLDFFKNIGHRVKGGFDKVKSVSKKIFDKEVAFAKGVKNVASKLTLKNAVQFAKDSPQNLKKAAKYVLKKGKSKAIAAGNIVRNKLAYATEHPFLAAGDAAVGTMQAVSHIPGVTPLAGAAAASSKWVMNSAEMMSPDSPVRKYIRASLDLYGVDNQDLYEFVHQIETDQEKVAAGTLKQYNHDDLKWFAGRFGLDPKNEDSVNYFVTWFNNRFLPMFTILRKILTKYNLTASNALNATNPVIEAAAKDLAAAFKTIPSSVSTLKPTLAAYKKLSDDSRKGASTLNPTTIKNPDSLSAVAGLPNTQQGGQSNASGPTAATTPTASGSPPAAGDATGSQDTGGPRETPDITPGNVSDQKEYKSAYKLLAADVKAFVDKDKSLQFTLWAESVQDGPEKTAHTFNTEYRAGETAKNFREDIYQDRGQHFTGNTDADKLSAMRQLAKEQDFAGTIGDGAAPTLDQMGQAIGHPIMAFGNGTSAAEFTVTDDKLSGSRQPRGIRNNNPGNINFNHQPGAVMETGTPNPRFAKFSTPEAGIRAAILNLQTYYYKHGLRTISQMINRWAPAQENATGSYIRKVSQRTGLGPNDPVNIKDPNTLAALVDAISRVENGKNPWASKDILVAKAVADGTSTEQAPLGSQANVQANQDRQNIVDSGSSALPQTNTLTRGQSDQTTMALAGGGSGGGGGADPSMPAGASGGATTPSGKSVPTAITANVDQSSVVDKLDAIHKTLQSSANAQATAPAPVQTATSSSPTPIQKVSQDSYTVNHTVVSPQGGNSGAHHANAVDMALKKVPVMAGATM